MVPQHPDPHVLERKRSERSACSPYAWRDMRRAVVALVLAGLACDAPAADAPGAPQREDDPALVALQASIEIAAQRADAVEERLRPVPLMTPGEEAALRRASNAVQLGRARALGVRPADPAELRAALDAGTLVALDDSSEYWVVRELDYSKPYVTPDVLVLLGRIGERFHARLDDMGLPAYRLEISSALRTPESQAELRTANVNAAAGTSTHEYGTTIDIAYSGYAAPADLSALAGPSSGNVAADAIAHRAAVALLEAAAARKSRELQKILGEVLRELQNAGDVLVTLERQQPVYHMTVARSLSGAE